MEEGEQVKLFLLDQQSEEYERVTDQFLLTLPNAKILRVDRIQNKLIIRRYFHRSQLMKDFGTEDLREEVLFHGTRGTQPELIYSGDEGFDLRFSAEGYWGRGNYFAVNSFYSHAYAFKQDHDNRSEVFKMFAAHVLTGNSIFLPRDDTLTKPPFLDQGADDNNSPDTVVRRRYDSVHGITQGTRVYITYDNEHAYPAYLITYTFTVP